MIAIAGAIATFGFSGRPGSETREKVGEKLAFVVSSLTGKQPPFCGVL